MPEGHFRGHLLPEVGEQPHPIAQEAVRTTLDKMVGPQEPVIGDKTLTDFVNFVKSPSQTGTASVVQRGDQARPEK